MTHNTEPPVSARVFYTDAGPDFASQVAEGTLKASYNDLGEIILTVESHHRDELTEFQEAYSYVMSYDAAAQLAQLLHQALKDAVEQK
jgi:hypothetical protein